VSANTNRSRGAEVGLPPRFAGRIPHEGSVISCIAGRGACRHAIGMFIVTEADAAAIRAVFDQEGELSAAIELRRRFPGITDNAKARECARSIAGCTPLPVQPRPVTGWPDGLPIRPLRENADANYPNLC
jgi:hypothetical protein